MMSGRTTDPDIPLLCSRRQPHSLDEAGAGAGNAEVIRLQLLIGVHGQHFPVDVLLFADREQLSNLARLTLIPGGNGKVEDSNLRSARDVNISMYVLHDMYHRRNGGMT